MIRLLTFTTLYPNAKRPSHGVFVENRLKHLIASGEATTKVVAPVPYVPAVRGVPDRYKVLSGVPFREELHGIEIYHPRYFLLPKVSMSAAPFLLYMAARRQLSALLAKGCTFDLIDAHYFYPDGVAATLLGRHFGMPVTITARGSDINLLAQYRLPRKMIRWAADKAAGIITVCEALKLSLVSLGVPPDKIRVLRNGVDLTMFRLGNRDEARRRYGFGGTTLLSVGNLIPLKGHDLAIRALALMPDMRLAIVGDGPERAALEALARRIGVADRVRFFGRVAHDTLPDLYRAADVLLLLSTSEGLANVLLEAMACGTPVVATPAGGTPEVVTTPNAGELLFDRTPDAVVQGITQLLARRPSRQMVRSHAEGFSWEATTRGQLDLFDAILDARRRTSVPHSALGRPGGRSLVSSSLDYRNE